MEGGKRVKEKDSHKKTEICACVYENVTHTHTPAKLHECVLTSKQEL